MQGTLQSLYEDLAIMLKPIGQHRVDGDQNRHQSEITSLTEEHTEQISSQSASFAQLADIHATHQQDISQSPKALTELKQSIRT